jgi:hypothetical protein
LRRLSETRGTFFSNREESKRLDYSKTPHMCFKAKFPPNVNGSKQISQAIERRFQVQFNSGRTIKTWFLVRHAISVRVGQKSFLVNVVKSNYDSEEWIIQVTPNDTPVGYSPELLQICGEIHALFAADATNSAIRWYFEGFRSQSHSVATPDELPWTQT